MRDRIQLSCVECRRNKKKCNRLSPTCSNCEKNSKACIYIIKSTNHTELILNSNNNNSNNNNNNSEKIKDEDREDKEVVDGGEGSISYYLKRKANRLETKWLNLIYTLERIVDFSQIDCKVENFLNNIDMELYKQITGKNNITKNPLISFERVELNNPGVNSELNRSIEILVGLSFQFSFLSPCSKETVQQCYSQLGINSYLVNCICASMLPRYVTLRGNTKKLELSENCFYLKAIHLLNSECTPLREILIGTSFLIWLEISFGNCWAVMIHFRKFASLCVENKINLLDQNYPLKPRDYNDLETCEKRNAWWTCTGGELLLSMAYHHPQTLRAFPNQVHAPHYQLNFNPGPYYASQALPECIEFESTYHQTIPNFKTFSIIVWAGQLLSPLVEISQNFWKLETSLLDQRLMLNTFKDFYPQLIQENLYLIDLESYKLNLRKDPTNFANNNMLIIVIGGNVLHILYWDNLSQYCFHLRDPESGQINKVKTKSLAKELIKFLKNTIRLPNLGNDPEFDLTQHYISCSVIPVAILQLIKVFTPMETLEDRETLEFFLEIMRFYSNYSPNAELYVKWCQSQIKTNGKFHFDPKSGVTGPVRGLLKFFQKT